MDTRDAADPIAVHRIRQEKTGPTECGVAAGAGNLLGRLRKVAELIADKHEDPDRLARPRTVAAARDELLPSFGFGLRRRFLRAQPVLVRPEAGGSQVVARSVRERRVAI